MPVEVNMSGFKVHMRTKQKSRLNRDIKYYNGVQITTDESIAAILCLIEVWQNS